MAIMEFKQAFFMCTAGFFLILVFMIDPTFQMPTEIAATTDDVQTSTSLSTTHLADSTTPKLSPTIVQTSTSLSTTYLADSTTPKLSPTTESSDDKNFCSNDEGCYSLFLAFFSATVFLLIILVLVLIFYRECPKPTKRINHDSKKQQKPGIESLLQASHGDQSGTSEQDSGKEDSTSLAQGDKASTSKQDSVKAVYSTCISLLELWQLVKLPDDCDENEQLVVACNTLEGCETVHTEKRKEDLKTFKSLYKWRREHADDQIPEIFQACRNAEMLQTLIKLTKFQSERDVTDEELEHILWHIGKKDLRNIGKLLKHLNITTKLPPPTEENLAKTVENAMPGIKKWSADFFVDTPRTWGEFSINPKVHLSLKLEELIDEDPELFTALTVVPHEEKVALTEDDIEKQAKLFIEPYKRMENETSDSKKSHHKRNKTSLDDGIVSSITEIIDQQLKKLECSNYEKRQFLSKAVEDASHTSEDIMTKIRGLVSSNMSKKDAEAKVRSLIIEDIAKALEKNHQ